MGKSEVLPLVSVYILRYIRPNISTNLLVKIDTHQQGQVRHFWVLFDPFPIEMYLNELFMLFYADFGPRVVLLKILSVIRPHVPHPIESNFSLLITTNTIIASRIVSMLCPFYILTLLPHEFLLVAIERHMQVKLLGCNSPLFES